MSTVQVCRMRNVIIHSLCIGNATSNLDLVNILHRWTALSCWPAAALSSTLEDEFFKATLCWIILKSWRKEDTNHQSKKTVTCLPQTACAPAKLHVTSTDMPLIGHSLILETNTMASAEAFPKSCFASVTKKVSENQEKLKMCEKKVGEKLVPPSGIDMLSAGWDLGWAVIILGLWPQFSVTFFTWWPQMTTQHCPLSSQQQQCNLVRLQSGNETSISSTHTYLKKKHKG